jgi:hypothetical protein
MVDFLNFEQFCSFLGSTMNIENIPPVGRNLRRTDELPHRGRPLRILLPSYRSDPYTGGQGVYMRHFSKALVDMGHHVDVISGPPYPHLDPRVGLIKLPSLDLYAANAANSACEFFA